MIIPSLPPLRDLSGTLESKLLQQVFSKAGAGTLLQNPVQSAINASHAARGSVLDVNTGFGGLNNISIPPLVDPISGDAIDLGAGAITSFMDQFSDSSPLATLTNDYSSVCGQMFTGMTSTMSLPASFHGGSGDPLSSFQVPTIGETMGLVQSQQSLQNKLGTTGGNDCAKVSSMLGSLVNSGSDALHAVSSAISSTLSGIGAGVHTLIANVSGALSDGYASLKAMLDSGVSSISPEFQSALASVRGAVSGAFSSISSAIAPITSAIGGAFSAITSAVGDAVSSITNAITDTIHEATISVLAAIRGSNPCLTAVLDGDNGVGGVLPPDVLESFNEYADSVAADRGSA